MIVYISKSSLNCHIHTDKLGKIYFKNATLNCYVLRYLYADLSFFLLTGLVLFLQSFRAQSEMCRFIPGFCKWASRKEFVLPLITICITPDIFKAAWILPIGGVFLIPPPAPYKPWSVDAQMCNFMLFAVVAMEGMPCALLFFLCVCTHSFLSNQIFSNFFNVLIP